jgi:hypothetical protein
MSAITPVFAAADVLAQTTLTGYQEPAPWGYVIAGWSTVVVGIASYATWVVVKGRRLARQLPPEDQRWL